MKLNKNIFLFLIFLLGSLAFFIAIVPARAGDIAKFSTQCLQLNNDGTEENCNHNMDSEILKEQCLPLFGSSKCSSMPVYLAELSSRCVPLNNPAYKCNLIPVGDIYGQEASKFANDYINMYEANQSTNNLDSSSNNSSNTSGTGNYAGLGSIGLPTGLGLPDPAGGIAQILANLLSWLLAIVGIIAIIAFVISGLQYFMASGDEKMVATAKKNMVYSILGVVVALSGFVVIKAIDMMLNAGGLF